MLLCCKSCCILCATPALPVSAGKIINIETQINAIMAIATNTIRLSIGFGSELFLDMMFLHRQNPNQFAVFLQASALA
tara:strand:+ start:910 stop:1143 length:234 start_codon:yes stop_codon:yes gene_type:complete